MVSKEEKNEFSEMIEARARSLDLSIMDAIISYCEEVGLEPEVAGTLVTFTLKKRIEEEATKLKFLKPVVELPVKKKKKRKKA